MKSKGVICHNLTCRRRCRCNKSGCAHKTKQKTYYCERCCRISYCSPDCRLQDMVEHAPRCMDIRTAGPFEYFDAMHKPCPLVAHVGSHNHGGPTHLHYSAQFKQFHEHMFAYAKRLPAHEKHHLSCACATPLDRCNFGDGSVMVQFTIVDGDSTRYTILVGFKCNRCPPSGAKGTSGVNHIFALVGMGRSAMCCISYQYGMLPESEARLSLFHVINVSSPELSQPPSGTTVGVLATRVADASAKLNRFNLVATAEMHGAPLWTLIDNKWELS